MRAYLLLTVTGRAETQQRIVRSITTMRGVTEAHVTSGPYDIIATVDVKSEKTIDSIAKRIKRSSNIRYLIVASVLTENSSRDLDGFT